MAATDVLPSEAGANPDDISARIRAVGLTTPKARWTNLRAAVVATGLIGGAVVGVRADRLAVWLPIWAVQMILLVSCNGGVHEGVHANLYQRRGLNHLAGMLFGLPLLFSYAGYRGVHLEHHAHTHAEGDGEPIMDDLGLGGYLAYMAFGGVAFIFMLLADMVAAAVGKPPKRMDTRTRRRVAKYNTALFGAAILVLAGSFLTWPLLTVEVWLVPVLLYSMVMAGMIALPEHFRCADGPAAATATTRTVRTNRLASIAFWGTNFHTVHHAWPSIPGDQLHVVDPWVQGTYAHEAPGYLRWHLRTISSLAR